MSSLDLLSEGSFSDSAILLAYNQRKFVRSLFDGYSFQPKVMKIYRGAIDGFSQSAIKSALDSGGSTITIIRTTKGRIFGAFTSKTYKYIDNTY